MLDKLCEAMTADHDSVHNTGNIMWQLPSVAFNIKGHGTCVIVWLPLTMSIILYTGFTIYIA